MNIGGDPVYLELIDFVASGPTPDDVANFRPSAQAQQRVSELMQRERESELTLEESAELDRYMDLEHILRMAKAKARLILSERS